MKIEIEAYRRLERLINELSDDLFQELLKDLKIEADEESGFSALMDKLEDEITVSQYKKIWAKAEIGNFFSSQVSPFKVKPQSISFAAAKRALQHEDFSNLKMIALELYKKPKFYFFARTPTTYRSMEDKTLTSEDIRDSAYYLPELGIVLMKTHPDTEGKLFAKLLEDQLTGEMEEFRFKSLSVTQQFNNERYINELVVSAMAQITGFDGMDEIKFVGPDVKLGLYGLRKRQDIRVHLHEIGPNLAVANKNLHIRVGNKMRIKNVEGFTELHSLMYADEYPDEDQVAEVKEELNEKNELSINSLVKRWKLKKDKITLILDKQIENGRIRARIENNKIVKL